MTKHAVQRVAVIGAGVSGVAATKCLLDRGITPVVFEQSSAIGGVWHFDEAQPDGGSPAYRSLRTNTPQRSTAFSSVPFPPGTPPFPSRAVVEHYLNEYADRFGVRDHICFHAAVTQVAPADGNRWKVCVATAAGERSDTFDAVFVCSGIFRDPLLPAYPGLDTFAGTVLHSRAYTDADRFAGQRVLVVGTGSSGSDIAVETSQVAQRLLLSGRRVDWRRALQAPAQTTTPWQRVRDRILPPHVRARLLRRWMLGWYGRLPEFRGLDPAPDAPFEIPIAPFVPNTRLRERLEAGDVVPKPAIERIEPHHVRFVDNTIEPVDAIIFATGYAISFPFLDPALSPVAPSGLELYRVVAHPDCANLFFIGMCRATGGIPPLAEMQARWAVGVACGEIGLPSAPQMHAAIDVRRRWIAAQHGDPFRLLFDPYVDLLARDLGILPRPWRAVQRWRALLPLDR